MSTIYYAVAYILFVDVIMDVFFFIYNFFYCCALFACRHIFQYVGISKHFLLACEHKGDMFLQLFSFSFNNSNVAFSTELLSAIEEPL